MTQPLETDSEYAPTYRTPAGRQNRTTAKGSACDKCGGPMDEHDPKIQGADDEAPPCFREPGRMPMLCHRCSLRSMLRPGY